MFDSVGRQEEMSQLRAVLETALAGQGSMVMLAGELGNGKARWRRSSLATPVFGTTEPGAHSARDLCKRQLGEQKRAAV